MTTLLKGRTRARTGEPAGVRWRRRAVSIPAMLVSTTVAFVAAPLVVAALALADLAAGRVKLPRVRIYGVALQYMFNDSVEIVLAPLYWVLAGFGTRLDSRASIRRHSRLQRWSAETVARRAERLLGIRIEVVEGEAGGPAPAIVLSRHVNIADSSVPGLLYVRHTDYDLRGVIMREMLSDPGFDLIYGRLGSVFVDRDSGAEARAAVRDLAGNLDDRSVAVIFPEGRLFRPDRRDRALERLADTDPERAARMKGLRHLLPPRPGGVIELLAGAPHADVAIVAHVGFETVPSFAELCRRVPLEHPIRVAIWRIPRAEIPEPAADRVRWLDEQWLRMDDWIEASLRAGESAAPASS